MPTDEKLLLFYKDMVNVLQLDKDTPRILYTQLLTLLLISPSEERNVKIYEYLLEINLVYRDVFDRAVSPFEHLDSTYFIDLIKDLIIRMEAECIGRLNNDIHSKEETIATSLLRIKDPEITKTYDVIYKLDTIIREGWKKRNVDPDYQESDITHTIQMFAFACAFYHENNLDLNLLKIYEMILIHEVGEILVGDFMEGTEEHLNKHDKERKAVVEIFSNLKNGQIYIDLWDEFEARITPEAKFVYCSDKLDPILKAMYLDKELSRTDLFNDFYEYEENRHTFDESEFKQLFYGLKNK